MTSFEADDTCTHSLQRRFPVGGHAWQESRPTQRTTPWQYKNVVLRKANRSSKGRREVDHPCITLTGMQLKEGDVKAHRAAVTE